VDLEGMEYEETTVLVRALMIVRGGVPSIHLPVASELDLHCRCASD
jgi:microcystin degradation protein MlrC